MANQLDEMNPEIISEGRDVHVIAKVIPVETSGFEKLLPTILMAVGVIGIVFGIVIDKYLVSIIGAIVLIYPWWRLKQISSEFNMMEQRIQNAASEIDNYMEQRVVILSNAAKLVEKSIEVDKDILVDIAKYRSGNFSEESRSDVNAQLNKATRALNVAIENYPELQSQDTIRDAMQQNSYLQKEITAARTLYNDAVNTWNSIKSSVTSIIQGLVNAAQNAWNTFKNGVQNLVNRVKNIFDSIKNIDLWGAGKAIMDGFLRGLKSVWGSITSFVGSIADWIRDHKGPIEVDRKLLIPAGTAIMESLDEGLTDKFESVKKTVGGMAGDINKAFTSEMTDFEVGANVSKNLQIDDMSKADFSMGDDDNEVIKALGVVQDLLKDISNKDFNTYLDGEVMAKNSYDRQMTFVRREGI